MKQGAKVSCLLAGSLALAACAHAATAETPLERHVAVMDNPYNPIVERNVFDLHDPPPPPEPKPTNAPPPNIHLTGITTVLGKKQAYFMLQSAPVPGKPAAGDKYMTLSEGQRQEMLEVLEINPAAKTVKISNSGNISTITFETNKIAFSAPPGGAAGVPGAHPPGAGPAPNYYPNSPATIPPRPMRPSGTTGVNPNGSGAQYAGGAQYGGYQAGVNGVAAAPAPVLDPDQQVVAMELYREATKDQVAAGTMPPLPPTPLSHILDAEKTPQQSTPPAPSLPNFPGQHSTIR